MFSVGVGQYPEPFSEMWSTHGFRRNNIPLRIIPERGKVSEYSARSPSKQSCDVLNDDVAGSKVANGSGIFPP
jgi:hypothetical protein